MLDEWKKKASMGFKLLKVFGLQFYSSKIPSLNKVFISKYLGQATYDITRIKKIKFNLQ